MLNYIIESWHIFVSNLAQINNGTLGALAVVFLFAIFLLFWNISGGFGSHKKD